MHTDSENNNINKISNDEINAYFSRIPNNFSNILKLLGLTTIFKKTVSYNRVTRQVILLNNDHEVGCFEITGDGDFNSGIPLYMNIHVDDELLKKNLSRLLVGVLIKQILQEGIIINKEQLLVIDGDGSGGFWNHIGLYKGRHSYMSNRPKSRRLNSTEGAEKEITFSKLSYWALGEILGV